MTEIIQILFTYNYKYGILIKQKLIYQRMKAISVNSYNFSSLIGYFKDLNLSFNYIIKDLQFFFSIRNKFEELKFNERKN